MERRGPDCPPGGRRRAVAGHLGRGDRPTHTGSSRRGDAGGVGDEDRPRRGASGGRAHRRFWGRGRRHHPGRGFLLAPGADSARRLARRAVPGPDARGAVPAQRRARARGDSRHHARVGATRMARFEFRLPDIGEGLAEAEVAKWLVAVGDSVTEDQPVVEMMTDKASVELPAPGAGVIVERLADEGELVKTGAVLYVLESDSRIGGSTQESPPAAASESPVREAATTPEGAAVLAPPAVRKLAREMGIDLAVVKGSGPGGRISADDLKRHGSKGAPPSTQGGRRIP